MYTVHVKLYSLKHTLMYLIIYMIVYSMYIYGGSGKYCPGVMHRH